MWKAREEVAKGSLLWIWSQNPPNLVFRAFS